jgi:16S rRNA (guanine527-N7)-methyltransferase
MPGSPISQLDKLLQATGLPVLQIEQNKQFIDYLSLLLRWNARTNLTSLRDPQAILARHFVESIACAHALPAGIGTLLDLGSGAGFPGIPIALCRPEIAVTLAESQGKKAAFLNEALRVLNLTTRVPAVRVHAGRAETLAGTFDCVTLRAVDRMESAVGVAAGLVSSGGWLAPLTTYSALPAAQATAGADFDWAGPIPLPGSDTRILALGRETGRNPVA